MKESIVKKLAIGRHLAAFPLLLGGMGVRVSGGRLAGHFALSGGFGTVAAAGIGVNSPYYDGKNFFAADMAALKEEIRKAYAIAPDGVIGVNCMVAVTNYDDMVRAACEAGAKYIVSGAGLPMNLPALTADYPEVALIPIVSSVRAAQLIARKWMQNFRRLPDAVVVEDPDTAGGHLGEKPEKIGTGCYDQYQTVRGVKDHFIDTYQTHVPVIAAGGIWDRQDLLQALAQGADGVQMASRFVCTEECDAEEAFKQAYLDCRPEDIGLVMSPAGLPGRALVANVERIRQADLQAGSGCTCACLKKCTYKETGERFCIINALDRAQRGDTDTGLIFCGSNAWKADRMTTVQGVFDELFALTEQVEKRLVVNA